MSRSRPQLQQFDSICVSSIRSCEYEKQMKKREKIFSFFAKYFPFLGTLRLFPSVRHIFLIWFLIAVQKSFLLNVFYSLNLLGNYSIIICLKSIIWGHTYIAFGYIVSPIFGYLGDSYFLRHKIINFGIVSTFVTSCLFIGFYFLIVHSYVNLSCPVGITLMTGIVILLIISMAAIVPLLLPFGIAQMEEANESNLKSFFIWYFWIENIASFLSDFYFVTFTGELFGEKPSAFSLHIAFLCILLVATVAIFIATVIFRYFIVTKKIIPVNPGGNPIKSIYRVTRKALKQRRAVKSGNQRYGVKYPEGSISLLDYAKSESCSNFEMVENVKTFFRIFLILACMIPIYAVIEMSTGSYVQQYQYLFSSYESVASIPKVFSSLIVILLVPFLELGVVKKKIPNNILTRVWIGISLLFASLVIATFVEFISTYFYPQNYSTLNLRNDTIFDDTLIDDYEPSTVVKLLFQTPQVILMGLGQLFAHVGLLEFIYAQAPHEMKCFIFGLFQCFRGIGGLLPLMINEVIQTASCFRCETCFAYHYQCKSETTLVAYTYLTGALLFACYLVLTAILFRHYKKRQRHPEIVWYSP